MFDKPGLVLWKMKKNNLQNSILCIKKQIKNQFKISNLTLYSLQNNLGCSYRILENNFVTEILEFVLQENEII